MGCNTSKGGIPSTGSNRDGWTLVRSLSRSWSMPYPTHNHSASPTESFHVSTTTTTTTTSAFMDRKFELREADEEEEEEDGEEDCGPGEVVNPSPVTVIKPGNSRKSSDRVRVPEMVDLWDQIISDELNNSKPCVKRRKRTYAKSASLPHIPAVFKPEIELVNGLSLVLEETSPNSSVVLKKSAEKARRPPLPPDHTLSVRKGLFYGGSLGVDEDSSNSAAKVRVPDASSSSPQDHFENSLDDEGWCLINRKQLRSDEMLRDKTNISEESRSNISRSLLDGFEKKCPPGGQDKVVFYFTSLRGIRKTYEQCRSVRMILEGLFTKVDERDVSMHGEFRQELKSLVGQVGVPRVFIKGRYIGGVEEVMQLNENGLIRQMVEGIPKERMKKRCAGCGGVRFIPCMECSGSCKLVGEDNEIVRCWDCNENGLVRCPVCCSD